MSNQVTCYSCGTIFSSSFYSGKCSTCQQTDRITEQKARDNRDQQANFEAQRIASQEAQWRQERMHEEQLQQNQAIALLNAHNAMRTAAAIEKQTQAIFETSIKPEDAYNKGYNYINSSFGYDNLSNLKLEVSEDGVVFGSWDKEPYITPTLNEQFFDGMYAGIDALPRIDVEVLWQQAYQAGRQNAKGTLGSQFCLDPNLEINSTRIYTAVYNSEFEFQLDEETGWLGMKYRPPFDGKYLSAAYKQGVDEAFVELNTPEMMEHRLATEVAEIKSKRYRDQLEAERLHKEKETADLIATIMGALLFLTPIVGALAAWFLTSGFTTLFLIAAIVIITINVIS
jgi:hypothetical protein